MSPSTLRFGDVRLLGSVRRSIQLFQGFRTQFDDEDRFYTLLGDDTVALVKEQTSVVGQRVVDIGGGRGHFAAAFRRAGAASVFVEPFWEAMEVSADVSATGLSGTGGHFPLPTGRSTSATPPMCWNMWKPRRASWTRWCGWSGLAGWCSWPSPTGCHLLAGTRRPPGTTSEVRWLPSATNGSTDIHRRTVTVRGSSSCTSATCSPSRRCAGTSRSLTRTPATTPAGPGRS